MRNWKQSIETCPLATAVTPAKAGLPVTVRSPEIVGTPATPRIFNNSR
jgi:hypothetical protein